MRRFWIWWDGLEESWYLPLILLFLTIGLGAISCGFYIGGFGGLFITFGGAFFVIFGVLNRIRFLNEKAKSKGLKTHGRRLG